MTPALAGTPPAHASRAVGQLNVVDLAADMAVGAPGGETGRSVCAWTDGAVAGEDVLPVALHGTAAHGMDCPVLLVRYSAAHTAAQALGCEQLPQLGRTIAGRPPWVEEEALGDLRSAAPGAAAQQTPAPVSAVAVAVPGLLLGEKERSAAASGWTVPVRRVAEVAAVVSGRAQLVSEALSAVCI